MIAHTSRTDGSVARPVGVVATVLRDSGGRSHAPVDLPLDQAMALAQFPADGIPEAQLARRLGMTAAEAARMREILLRRRLVIRTPRGRARAASRLGLTDRGHRASSWLDQLQISLSPTLFDTSEPPAAGQPESAAVTQELERPGDLPMTGFLAWRHRGRDEKERRTLAVGLGPVPEAGVFERGLLNIWLGTGFFAGAVVVGIILQSERSALVALGVGCFIALVFFVRAGVVLFRQARARARATRRSRAPARAHRRLAWRRHRPPSRGALQ
jgi:DNA-binding MarR family transcriptional regulator